MSIILALTLIWTAALAWLLGLLPGLGLAVLPRRLRLPEWGVRLLTLSALALEIAAISFVGDLGGAAGMAAGCGFTAGAFWGWSRGLQPRVSYDRPDLAETEPHVAKLPRLRVS